MQQNLKCRVSRLQWMQDDWQRACQKHTENAVNQNAKVNMSESVSVLYRPVGKAEMEKIADSGFRAFPPRLPEQPFFLCDCDA